MITGGRLLCPAGLALAIAAGAPIEAASQTYVVDPGASRVRIHLDRAGLAKFMGHEHEIEAPVAEGRVVVVDDDPSRSTVALRFASARLAVVPGSEPASDIPAVEERMRGPEVLDVGRFPEIAFVSRSVRGVASEGELSRVVVSGSLTLHGRTVPVEISLDVARAADGGLQARGSASLELRNLGVEPPSVGGVVKVANRFRLEFDIRASASATPGPGDQRPGAVRR